MGISDIIRGIIPVPLRKNFRTRTENSQPYLWEGIYSHYRNVPATGERFNSDYWIARTRGSAEQALIAVRNYRSIPTDVVGEHMLLPLLVSIVCQGSNNGVNILDFGGGMGIGYVHLMSSLVNCEAINFHIVESERVAAEGRRLFQGDERIRFYSELPDLVDLDIIYLCSSLQYIEDYASLLLRLAAYKAKFFFFVKLSAGDFPTYATAQMNMPNSTLPYWFTNVDEIIELLAACGYSLIYKSALEQEYDQSNFPPEFRLGRAANLLFSRN